MNRFQTGYILSPRSDMVWFLGLPFAAVAIALASQQWLTAAGAAAFGLWITLPHHLATWIRTYGLPDERTRWRGRLFLGPVVLFSLALAGGAWAPISTALFIFLWDHQHSLMQQHGFARIYDFKAGTGAPITGKFDLALNWVLFTNLVFTSPRFSPVILRDLYRLRFPITLETVEWIQNACWTITAAYLVIYVGHCVWCLAKGHRLNPIKYLFIGASYFLWYYCGWNVATLLIFDVAHRIMHGVQYIVIVYWYLRRKTQTEDEEAGPSRSREFVRSLVQPGHIIFFLLTCAIYLIAFHFLVGGSLESLSFDLIDFSEVYQAIPALELEKLKSDEAYAMFAVALISTVSMTHYYFDSFIWKVSDRRTQTGLK